MNNQHNTDHAQETRPDVSRRRFLRNSTLAVAGTAAIGQLPFAITTHAADDTPIRIGLIGCGGRGTGALANALGAATQVVYPLKGYHTEDVREGTKAAARGVTVVALADVFPDRLQRCRDNIRKLGIAIPDDHCFTGFDAYKKLLEVPEVNYVILATPPHFRPDHLMAAVQAGKHVFMEKPVAVDGPGVRKVIEAGELAQKKGLNIAAGTQRRHQRSYIETVKRIHDGALGEIVECRAYWNGGPIWVIERQAGWSDMEWQLRNWPYFTWLSGDHIVEQHVHNLDVINWVMNDVPVRAMALGGRLARTDRQYGHIYDHFSVEFEYANGVRMFSFCRQMSGCDNKVGEEVVGEKGSSNCAGRIWFKNGERWRLRERDRNPYEQEHIDLMNAIRSGQALNEARNVALSTLTAIMGRESAYSGKTLTREQVLNSNRRLGPTEYKFGPLPFPEVAIPGRYAFA